MFWRRRAKPSSAIRDSALEQIARTWSVDETDVTPHEHGFDWLPGSHAVRVRIYKDVETPGPERFRLTITTGYLRNLPAQDAMFVRNASLITKLHCPTYSLIYPPTPIIEKHFDGHAADMNLFSSAYISEGTAGWLPGFLARMSIMQPIDAELFSTEAAEFIGGGVPAFAGDSKRKPANGVLEVHHALRKAGDAQNRWIGSDEFEAFAEAHARSDLCFGFGDECGMTLETPFGQDSVLITFRTDQQFPSLGNGLFIETQIRSSEDFDNVCANAAVLNFLESVDWSDFPQMGCWHPQEVSEEQTNLAHTCFIPNAFFAEGLIVNFGMWALARVQRALRALCPEVENLTMREILEARYRAAT